MGERGAEASKIQCSRLLGVLKGAIGFLEFSFSTVEMNNRSAPTSRYIAVSLFKCVSTIRTVSVFSFIPTRQNGFQDRGPAPHPLDRGHHQVLEMRSTLVKPNSTGWSLPRCWQGHQPRQQEQTAQPSQRSRSVRPSRRSPGIAWSEVVFTEGNLSVN